LVFTVEYHFLYMGLDIITIGIMYHWIGVLKKKKKKKGDTIKR